MPGPYTVTVLVSVDDNSIESLLMRETFEHCFPVGGYLPDKDTLHKHINKLAVRYKFWANINQRTDMGCARGKRVHSNRK